MVIRSIPLAELVDVRTEDGVLLHGAFFEAEPAGESAALIIHGGWGNFYTGLGRFLPGPLTAAGISCLSLNNRGHDYGTVADGEPCIGLMREQFEDCPLDISAGLRLLREGGYRQLVLIGHSYGVAKVVYSQYWEPNPAVKALILCSPAALMKDAWKFYLDIPYDEAVGEARRLVEEGRGEHFVIFRHEGPIPLVATARTFLSVWGPDTAHDVRKYMDQIVRPLLVTICRGDRMCFDYTRVAYECALHAEPREFIILPGGNHYYQGVERMLADKITGWLSRIGLCRH